MMPRRLHTLITSSIVGPLSVSAATSGSATSARMLEQRERLHRESDDAAKPAATRCAPRKGRPDCSMQARSASANRMRLPGRGAAVAPSKGRGA